MMYSSQLPTRRADSLSPPGGEPMALGSPTASPHSPQKNYLPPFLFGDVPSSHVSSTHHTPLGPWISPQPKSNHMTFSTPQMVSSPIMARKHLYQSPSMPNTSLMSSPSIRKPGAPPVESLFGTLSVQGQQQQQSADLSKIDNSLHVPGNLTETSFSDYHQANGVLTPNMTFNSTANNTSTFVSPAQIDPFYTQGESLTLNSQLDESWITVFGFPPAATSFILQQFSQYGKIVEHKLATSGNWIHLRYQSKLQAKKALSKNGKIFGGNIMVGVKPCIEIDLMNESGKENSALADTSANFCQDSRDLDLNSSKRSLANIRPLTQIYKTPTSDTEGSSRSTTQSKGLVSKAMEYLKW